MLNLLGAVGQFEREVMLERQRVGIARAKADGKYRGRKPTAKLKADRAKELWRSGLRPAQIATCLGIGRASVYRLLSDRESKSAAPKGETQKAKYNTRFNT
jgi:DNA invertase Pin-like site-specific DNA recombinase